MPEITPSRYVVNAGWDDAPHLDEQTKAELLESTPPHLRKARSQGVPSLGSGAIYPIDWEEVTVHPFAIPEYWKKGYALDVGWNNTAALWGAQDPSDGVLYVYSEYKSGGSLPLAHAAAIKMRGEWIKGAIDPGARISSQADGKKLLVSYRNAGLKLSLANNARETGLFEVLSALTTGRMKLFTTLRKTHDEYLLYRRDEKGKVVKDFDHCLDCLRYLWMTWKTIASVKVVERTAGQTGPAGPSDSLGGY